MDKNVRRALLFDFYGELLTDHQRQIYSDHVLDDLSYTEIGANEGISRQAVFDLVKRCDTILEDYEKKLGLLKKFLDTKEKIDRIHELATELWKNISDREMRDQISEIEEIFKDIYESY